MLSVARFRTVLAVDAVGTVLAGLLVVARPDWLDAAARVVPVPGFRTLRAAVGRRRIGAAVAAFGALKGAAYAVALRRERRGE